MKTTIRKYLPLLLAVLFGAVLTWMLLKPVRAERPGTAEGESASESTQHDDALRLSDAQLRASGITLQVAGHSPFVAALTLPGQLVLNTDREARVLPTVPGLVRSVPVQVGAVVKAGTVLATIESRELAEVAARYLAARERLVLAQAMFSREEGLWLKKISAEQDYLAARRELNEARVDTQSALQSLLALGMSERDAHALKPGARLSSYLLRAPIGGTVLSRDLTIGEAVSGDKVVFRIADLGSLWVDLAVSVEQLASIKPGQVVQILDKTGMRDQGRVIFVQPELNEASRTGSVRVQLDNRAGRWRAGQFIQAELQTGVPMQALNVPASALQSLDGKTVVFVAGATGLVPREVTLGRRGGEQVEVLEGLRDGERYATGNVFVLKAELKKGEAEHDE